MFESDNTFRAAEIVLEGPQICFWITANTYVTDMSDLLFISLIFPDIAGLVTSSHRQLVQW